MVDANLKVEPIRICVDTINASINSNGNRDLRSTPLIPKKIISPWMTTLGNNLINNVQVTIGDNTTKVENTDGKLKIEHYYKDILQKTENKNVKVIISDNKTNLPLSAYFTIDGKLKTENEIENKYYYLDKQTYTERELVKNLELIGKHPECIIEKYNTINWNDDIYAKVIDIADYIYEDYFQGGQDGLCYFSFIYNNIIVYIENDSEISEPIIEFKYVKSQINECDLNTIKKTFNFLNKEMNQD